MGIMLLRDDRRRADHYVVPLAVGALIGGIEAAFFLAAKTPLFLALPLLLFVFVLRPVRRALATVFHPGRR